MRRSTQEHAKNEKWEGDTRVFGVPSTSPNSNNRDAQRRRSRLRTRAHGMRRIDKFRRRRKSIAGAAAPQHRIKTHTNQDCSIARQPPQLIVAASQTVPQAKVQTYRLQQLRKRVRRPNVNLTCSYRIVATVGLWLCLGRWRWLQLQSPHTYMRLIRCRL